MLQDLDLMSLFFIQHLVMANILYEIPLLLLFLVLLLVKLILESYEVLVQRDPILK